MKYDADYLFNFLEAIPDRKWCVGEWQNEKGQRCAGGLCGEATYSSTRASRMLNEINKAVWGRYTDDINDGSSYCPDRLRQYARPRTRILHALREAKKRGY